MPGMAIRTWGRVLLAALGAGIVAGAGQLGIAYGLGIVRFNRTFDAATTNHWPAQLVWTGWFAMVAAVVGAVIADRLARRYELPTTLGAQASTSAAAALGALVVAPLSMQPARMAQVASTDPVTSAGVAAALGAGVGLVAALATLGRRPVGWNIGAVTGVAWFLAVMSVMPSLGPTDPLPAVRLGGLDPSWLNAGTSQRLAVVTMPALALVVGALGGAVARWHGFPVPVVAACGVAGPAMLALAYLVAGAGEATDAYQAAPYWGALIAAGAGALGSVLAAAARWPLIAAGPAETDGPASTVDTAPSITGTPPGSPITDPPTTTFPTPTLPAIPSPRMAPESIEPPHQSSLGDPGTRRPAPPDAPTTPASAPTDDPTAGPATVGLPADRSGARRPRTEDFWPTATPEPPVATPPAVLPAATPPAPTPPATGSDDSWDAFTPVSRTRPDRGVPVSGPGANADRFSPGQAEVSQTIPVVAGGGPPKTTTDGAETVGRTPTETVGRTSADDEPSAETEDNAGNPGTSGGRTRRGLFRRNRTDPPVDPERTGPTDAGSTDSTKQRESKSRSRTDEPVPAHDEEYVDWVTGLGEPDPAAEELGPDRSARRSLRSTGRHHAD